MDCAKSVGARIAQPNKPINKMRGLLRVHRLLPLLIAVPNTASTGSEVTLAAVITDSETHYKYPINDFVLIPRFAVHDPEFARSARLHYGADGHGRPDACRRGLYRLGRSNERRLGHSQICDGHSPLRHSRDGGACRCRGNPLYPVLLLMDRLELMRMYEVVAGGMFEGEN